MAFDAQPFGDFATPDKQFGSRMANINDTISDSAVLTKPFERRLMGVLGGLYLAQGIPTYLLLVALPPIMRESGASRTAIGLFSLLMLPLILKFLVAPLVDRWSPWPKIGHRRGWVVPTQLLVSAGIASMALVDPSNVSVLFAICICITVISSIQDIATDGYAVRQLTDRTRSMGNAVACRCQHGFGRNREGVGDRMLARPAMTGYGKDQSDIIGRPSDAWEYRRRR